MYPLIVSIFKDPEAPHQITMDTSIVQELSSDDMLNDIPFEFPRASSLFNWITPNIEIAVENYLLKTNKYEVYN